MEERSDPAGPSNNGYALRLLQESFCYNHYMDVYGYSNYLLMGLFFSIVIGFPVWGLLTYASFGVLSWRKSFEVRPRKVKILISLCITLLLWILFITIMYRIQGDSAGNRLF